MRQHDTGKENTLGIGGMTLHYVTWGERNPERVVLLVHGLTASCREFALFGPALAEQGWYAVAPDLRGRGLSAKPPHGYAIPFHAHDLLTLCDALGAQQAHIVGHSLGAMIGVYTAALYPQRVRKLVMIDAGGKIPEDTQQAIAASVNRLGVVFPSLDAYLGLMSQLPVFQWNTLWEEYFRYDAEVHPDGTVTSRVPKHVIEEESFSLGALRTELLPAFVKQPTLIVRAALGTLAPDRGFVLAADEAERLRHEMADCQVVEIPDTNHYTIVLSDALEREIVSFLGEPA
ncbi:MAG: hypothetical protein OJF49_004348 [Ktedonobacterales bacterium]|jgi:pimeloyl-ACP methyl ester carboxylesterase|nr:MAG: hypothetical protein OJF49_004348 [Ktedonobacterales bacterium]